LPIEEYIMSSHVKSVSSFANLLADLLATASAQWREPSELRYSQVEARYAAACRAAPAGVCVPPLDEAGLPKTCRRVVAVFTAGGEYDEAENHPIVAGNEDCYRTWRRIVEGLQSAAVLAAGSNGQDNEETAIFALGQQQYRLGAGPVVRVSDPQDDVLQSYLDSPRWKAAQRLTTAELEERSKRVGQIHRIMKALKTSRLGAAISLPGRKRKGQGYGVRVRRYAPTSV
jgi:hypothetical protein